MQHRSNRGKNLGNKIDPCKTLPDLTSSLSDALILDILRRQPLAPYPCSLVCKRWLRLHSSLRQSIRVQEWTFLESGRMSARFPNLTDIDLSPASVLVPRDGPSILLSHLSYTIRLVPDVLDLFPVEECIQQHQISFQSFDNGLKVLANAFPCLQKLSLVDNCRSRKGISKKQNEHGLEDEGKVQLDNVANDDDDDKQKAGTGQITSGTDAVTVEDLSDFVAVLKLNDEDTVLKIRTKPKAPAVATGLAIIAKTCHMLQELELYQCTDESLTAISSCQNLQIVHLVGCFTSNSIGSFTDVGLTTLASRCSRLVKLEICGCEASYCGIQAIGKYCLMLEELTLSTRGFQDGWVAALAHCSCLKRLRLESCKQIDPNPGPSEYLGHCAALDCLEFVRCDFRDRAGFAALLTICRTIRELEFQDCWGLEDEAFAFTAKCRRIRRLSLEGCSLLTTSGLEGVLTSWKDLQRLRVVFCDNIRDSEISPALANCFASLKEFKWRPDTRYLLAASLAGTGVGQKGDRFFKKV